MIKLKKLLFLSLVFFMKPAFAENPYEGFIYKSWYQGPDIESLLTEVRALSDCTEKECTQHTLAIKKLFQANKLDASAIKYAIEQVYPNLENEANVAQIIGYNFENFLVNLAIDGKEKYLDMLFYTADFKKHPEHTKLMEEYENIRVRREMYVNSLCFLGSNLISNGSLYPNLYARCVTEKNHDYLNVIEETIGTVQSFKEE